MWEGGRKGGREDGGRETRELDTLELRLWLAQSLGSAGLRFAIMIRRSRRGPGRLKNGPKGPAARIRGTIRLETIPIKIDFGSKTTVITVGNHGTPWARGPVPEHDPAPNNR